MLGIAAQMMWAVSVSAAVALALVGVGLVCVHRKTAAVGVILAALALGAFRYGEAIVRPVGDVSWLAPAKSAQVGKIVKSTLLV